MCYVVSCVDTGLDASKSMCRSLGKRSLVVDLQDIKLS